jgi:hypothetical protein
MSEGIRGSLFIAPLFRKTKFLPFFSLPPNQGCQVVYFQTKNPNLGKFWSVLQCKMLVYFMAIWSSLRPFGRFCVNLVCFIVIWYIFPPWNVAPRKIWQPCSKHFHQTYLSTNPRSWKVINASNV